MSTATELLRRALEAWEHGRMLRDMDDAMVEIRAYLAAEKEEEQDLGSPSIDGPFDNADDLIASLKKSEKEAETIETLKAENFKLASGQCTEGGPWGDEGGTPYCKYTRPEKEAEPLAWMFQHEDTGLIDYVDTQQVEWGFEKNNPRWQKIGPVYLHPPRPDPNSSESIKNQEVDRTRKPMSDEELAHGFTEPRHSQWQAFVAGARWAEKQHGIGGSDD
jgi:hypothetical protein